jgi:hypothetical protein
MMGSLSHHFRFPYTILLCIHLEYPISPRGGFRPGAGRKLGSNEYGESTRAIRVPVSLYPEIQSLLESIKARRRHGVAPAAPGCPIGRRWNKPSRCMPAGYRPAFPRQRMIMSISGWT